MGEVIKKFMENETNQLKECTNELDNVVSFPKKQRYGGKQKGQSSEVYPLKTKEEIDKMKQYFRNKLDKSIADEDKQIAARNLMLFIVGINIGLRCGDLTSLKYGEIFNNDGTFKEGIRREEEKTGKFKTFFLNKSCQDAITEYVNTYVKRYSPDDYLFISRENKKGSKHIEVQTVGKIIKKAGEECNINKNLSTHTLRKTFGFWFYKLHSEDVRALTHLQRLFNHASPRITLAYIGLEDEESKEFYDDLNL